MVVQYFTGTTGTIYSYNYAGGTHLAGQQYNNCIRTEAGYCSISYSSTAFSVSGSAAAAAVGPAACTTDFVTIPFGGSSTADPTSSGSSFCGQILSHTAAAAQAAVLTKNQPFLLGVNFDSGEVGPGTTQETGTAGFAITYSQSTTC